MKHIIALSGGKDSTALALRLAEVEPREYEYVFTPTGDELPPMVDHWARLQALLGKRLTPISCGRSLDGLIRLQGAVPNWRMRWCTRMLKIEPFEQYILRQSPCVVYVGIRADETDRDGVAYERFAGIERRYPLVEWGWGIGCVLDYLKQRGVVIPERTDCANCFFQTLYEWYVLWSVYPERYAQGESWEALTGHTLRSEQRDSHPAALAALRKDFEGGYVPTKRTMADRRIMCSVCSR